MRTDCWLTVPWRIRGGGSDGGGCLPGQRGVDAVNPSPPNLTTHHITLIMETQISDEEDAVNKA